MRARILTDAPEAPSGPGVLAGVLGLGLEQPGAHRVVLGVLGLDDAREAVAGGQDEVEDGRGEPDEALHALARAPLPGCQALGHAGDDTARAMAAATSAGASTWARWPPGTSTSSASGSRRTRAAATSRRTGELAIPLTTTIGWWMRASSRRPAGQLAAAARSAAKARGGTALRAGPSSSTARGPSTASRKACTAAVAPRS